jgi:SNF2 family DNA or RNA helicase
LSALLEESIGGMLCDEMGLGKTAQALGLISFALKRKNLNLSFLMVIVLRL